MKMQNIVRTICIYNDNVEYSEDNIYTMKMQNIVRTIYIYNENVEYSEDIMYIQ